VALWEALQKDDQKTLRAYIRWEKQTVMKALNEEEMVYEEKPRVVYEKQKVIFIGTLRHQTILTYRKGQRLFSWLSSKDVRFPAWHFLAHFINDHLATSLTQQLLWDDAYEKLCLYVQPLTLLAGLWFQFAQALQAHWQYRHCEHCGKPFIAAP